MSKNWFDVISLSQFLENGKEMFLAQTKMSACCGCAAVTLAAYITRQIASGEWKRVLFLPTGALLSKTSFNEGKSVPGIAHAVVFERYEQ